jgi:hypothetical protein
MATLKVPEIILLILSLLFLNNAFCQLPFGLVDGRQHKYCEACNSVIEDIPKEVLFGLQINTNGDIYFSMNNKIWFDKIFKNNSYGVTIDLVSEDRYACAKKLPGFVSLPKGTMLTPVYRPALLKGVDNLSEGRVFIQIGKLPNALRNKKMEGNLVILNGNYICYYTNFVNLDRNVWQLLPMGLFTDSLLQNTRTKIFGENDFFTYSKKLQVEIPFAKGSSSLNGTYLDHIYDSLDLEKFNVRKIEVRAYSSVEGAQATNINLMNQRADNIVKSIKLHQPNLHRINIVSAENWLGFYKDISTTAFSSLQNLSKPEIKQKLTDQTLLTALEPLLAKQRKAIVTIFLDAKTAWAGVQDSTMIRNFSKAVDEKNIDQARDIQKEVIERVMDNKLPISYIDRLEVPKTKEFSTLLSDREVYKYLLKATDEYEALENFLTLKKLDPENGKINYNICALRFFMWQYGGDSTAQNLLKKEMSFLPKQGINNVLVKRMLANYHILKCEENMRVFNYDGKDSSLSIIHEMYEQLNLNDEDIYSLAKYYANYSQQNWAEELIQPRIDQTDVSEDLVFYYLNLLFFSPASYGDENFNIAVLNAINLNRRRFCNFFLPNDKGGASMQLLEDDDIRKKYCEECGK